jgi:hypothetical protein
MRHIFARLTAVGLLALAASQGSRVRGEESGNRGQELVAEAARRLQAEKALSAELRYRIDAYGHQLIGAGNYLQWGAGPERLLKLELQMRVGNRPATLQEVRGDDFYWVRRDVPPQPPSLWRVNLRQLRDSVGRPIGEAASDVLPQGAWIMLGGLPQLLASLEQNFAFDTPREDELQFRAADGQSVERVAVWTVAGRWKPERLAALTGRDTNKKSDLPEQLPEKVELVLGRTDAIPPLFPCRITYWQAPGVGSGRIARSANSAPRELLTLDLFHVDRQAKIDRGQFLFNPGELDVEDRTARYIQRLSGASKLR